MRSYLPKEQIKKKLLIKLNSLECNVTSICRGIVDTSQGLKYIKEMEQEKLVELKKKKNLTIIVKTELGVERIKQIEEEIWK
jgi:hypothetical protein